MTAETLIIACSIYVMLQQDIDGKAYYQFEFIAQAPNYTRHALSKVSIGNGMTGSLLVNIFKCIKQILKLNGKLYHV